MTLTTQQIKTIIRGNEENLKMLAASSEYQAIENHDYFSTSNDVNLADAINALYEIYEAIISLEYQQEIDADEARSEVANPFI